MPTTVLIPAYGPFGGVITGAATITPGQQRAAAQFEGGSGKVE
jgi:hypothetical protein